MRILSICVGLVAFGSITSARQHQCVPYRKSSSLGLLTSSSSSGIPASSSVSDSTFDSSTEAATDFTTLPTEVNSAVTTTDTTTTLAETNTEEVGTDTTTDVVSIPTETGTFTLSTTTELSTTETPIEPIEPTTTETPVEPATTESPTTTEEAAASTSSPAAVPLSTFTLVAAGTQYVDGEQPQSGAAFTLMYFKPSDPTYGTHTFSIEDSTDYLMTNGLYVLYVQTNGGLSIGTAQSSSSVLKHIVCARGFAGEEFSCHVNTLPGVTGFFSSTTVTSNIPMFMYEPFSPPADRDPFQFVIRA